MESTHAAIAVVPKVAFATISEVRAFVHHLMATTYFLRGHEKRSERRYPVFPVRVCPLNGAFEPVGIEFAAVARNISAGGLAIFCTGPVSQQWLAVELTSPQRDTIRAAVKVVRSRAVGPFYEIVGNFISDVNT